MLLNKQVSLISTIFFTPSPVRLLSGFEARSSASIASLAVTFACGIPLWETVAESNETNPRACGDAGFTSWASKVFNIAVAGFEAIFQAASESDEAI
jgi:hypothetical protein